MTIQRIATTIPASGQYELPAANYFLFLFASAGININIIRDGTGERFNGISGGLLARRVKPWLKITLVGAAGTSFETWIGDELVDRDETDVRLAVTAIAGIASVNQIPNTDFTDRAPLTILDTATGVVAANVLRKGLTLFGDPNNAGVLKLRVTGGANNIGFVPIGGFVSWRNTDGLDIFNDSGATGIIYVLEES